METQETYARLHQQVTDRGPWQQTASGNAFFLGYPDHLAVRIDDIATSLSNQCRYNGHVKHFYSVAQHAMMVSQWMEEDGCDTISQYAGLHHDSAEAYTGDIIAQMKWLTPEFKEREERVEKAVNKALGVDTSSITASIVKDYDFLALATEVRDVLNPNQTEYSWGDLPEPRDEEILAMDPTSARVHFLGRHVELQKQLGMRS